jgi:long-subunit acyl-CoA synthetase (AMP-forming)
VTIKQGYGMTETTVALAYGSGTLKLGSVGKLVPNIEARLVDPETGKDVTKQDAEGGTTGELWVRGPSIVKGYYKNEKATRETINEEGWLKTGDVVNIDKDGDLFIVDRLKELIKVKGFQ